MAVSVSGPAKGASNIGFNFFRESDFLEGLRAARCLQWEGRNVCPMWYRWNAIQAYRGHHGDESKASIAMQFSISEQTFRDHLRRCCGWQSSNIS